MLKIGFVYVLSNPTMTGLLKIGYTVEDVEYRAREISTPTGVPQPYVVEYWHLTVDPEVVEREVHEALRDYRESMNREFFRTSVTHAAAVIEDFVRVPKMSYRRSDDPPAEDSEVVTRVDGKICRMTVKEDFTRLSFKETDYARAVLRLARSGRLSISDLHSIAEQLSVSERRAQAIERKILGSTVSAIASLES